MIFFACFDLPGSKFCYAESGKQYLKVLWLGQGHFETWNVPPLSLSALSISSELTAHVYEIDCQESDPPHNQNILQGHHLSSRYKQDPYQFRPHIGFGA